LEPHFFTVSNASNVFVHADTTLKPTQALSVITDTATLFGLLLVDFTLFSLHRRNGYFLHCSYLLMLFSYIQTIFVLMACLQEICAISLSLIQNVTLAVCRVYVLEKSVKSEITICRVKTSWEKWG